MNRLHTSFASFNASIINENAEVEMDMDETILDSLVDLVGSEADVEECAREAFEDLKKSFERNEVEIPEGKKGEHLAISALIVKLVEKGKLGPHEADSFIDTKLNEQSGITSDYADEQAFQIARAMGGTLDGTDEQTILRIANRHQHKPELMAKIAERFNARAASNRRNLGTLEERIRDEFSGVTRGTLLDAWGYSRN